MPHDDKGFLGDKTLQVLDRAYRDARQQLKQASHHDADNPEVQRRMARQIIERAKEGERNPVRLVARALSSFAFRR